jgi:hypothetical protein
MTMMDIKRLKYLLPDFARWGWVSESARNVWEPRLKRITNAWFDIEWQAVLTGFRPCGLTFATPEDLVAKTDIWVKYGLISIPLETQGTSNSIYASTPRERKAGGPFVYRVVVTKPETVPDFKKAWDENDHPKIGELLGYPACCQEFFHKIWIGQRMVDTTWPMAAATASVLEGDSTLEVTGPAEANILWRWMGIRAVPHLPCSFTCQPTVEFGKEMIKVGRDAGYDPEMDWMLEILSWPVEWSALHGIAEIKTPILRVSARTDATPRKYVVRRMGNTYPAEGTRGLVFPYETPEKLLLTRSQGYSRGLENPIPASKPDPDWYVSDNGFDSVAAMDEAHQPIVKLAVSVLKEFGGNVLDLGCGNGVLLKKICDITPQILPYGIEIDPVRHQHIAEILPEFFGHFERCNIFESNLVWEGNRRFSMAVLMPGRLLEAAPGKVQQLKKRLQEQSYRILVYAYGDWLDKFDGLHGLVCQAGMTLLSDDPNPMAGFAEFV